MKKNKTIKKPCNQCFMQMMLYPHIDIKELPCFQSELRKGGK
jgi:hypothetical protein